MTAALASDDEGTMQPAMRVIVMSDSMLVAKVLPSRNENLTNCTDQEILREFESLAVRIVFSLVIRAQLTLQAHKGVSNSVAGDLSIYAKRDLLLHHLQPSDRVPVLKVSYYAHACI